MNKNILYVLGAIIIFLTGLFIFTTIKDEEKVTPIISDYKNIEYSIGGMTVKLKDGVSEIQAAPGSATKVITRYFGNEVRKDINSDGREDIVFIVTQTTGGSGTFYYVVAALNLEQGYLGSQGLLLGDRIAPQTTVSERDSLVLVTYADRKTSESFATQPSVGKSMLLKFDTRTMQFGEVVQNFEGEADPSRMSLQMKKWQWVSGVSPEGENITLKKPEAFILTFQSENHFSATTDCNGLGGDYSQKGNKLSFSKMISTLMYCEGSDESTFVSLLSKTSTYNFTSKGELVLHLDSSAGELVFK